MTSCGDGSKTVQEVKIEADFTDLSPVLLVLIPKLSLLTKLHRSFNQVWAESRETLTSPKFMVSKIHEIIT